MIKQSDLNYLKGIFPADHLIQSLTLDRVQELVDKQNLHTKPSKTLSNLQTMGSEITDLPCGVAIAKLSIGCVLVVAGIGSLYGSITTEAITEASVEIGPSLNAVEKIATELGSTTASSWDKGKAIFEIVKLIYTGGMFSAIINAIWKSLTPSQAAAAAIMATAQISAVFLTDGLALIAELAATIGEIGFLVSDAIEVQEACSSSTKPIGEIYGATSLPAAEELYSLGIHHLSGDLFAIKKHSTGTYSTEVHILTAESKYQKFSVQTGTPLPETDEYWSFFVKWDRDIIALNNSNGQLKILSAISGYQSLTLDTETAIPSKDPFTQFAMIPTTGDILVLAGFPEEPPYSPFNRISIVPAATQYQTLQTFPSGPALPLWNNTFQFPVDLSGNLVAIKCRQTGTQTTEVHLAPPKYGNYTLETGTHLHETDPSYYFGVDKWNKLIAFKVWDTPSNMVEFKFVHVHGYE